MKKLILLFSVMSLSTFVNAQNISAKDTVSKMNSKRVGELALLGKMGTCVLSSPLLASYKYMLQYNDSGVKKKYFYNLSFQPATFSGNAVLVPISVQFAPKNKTEILKELISKIGNNFWVGDAHAQAVYQAAPQMSVAAASEAYYIAPADFQVAKTTALQASTAAYTLNLYTKDVSNSLLEQAGTFIKTLVASNKCGSISFETYKNSISNMNSVEFFRDPATGSIKCSELGFVKKIRAASSCNYIDVRSELPAKTCRMLYQIKLQKSQVARINASESSSGGGGGVAAAPVLSQLTAAIAQEFAISRAIELEPSLVASTIDAGPIKAEGYLKVDHLEFLESAVFPTTAAQFNSLSAANKLKYNEILATLEIAQGASELPAFSSNVVTAFSNSAINAAAKSYLVANPSVAVEAVALPSKAVLQAQLTQSLQPLIAAGLNYNLSLDCAQLKAVASVAAVQAAQ